MANSKDIFKRKTSPIETPKNKSTQPNQSFAPNISTPTGPAYSTPSGNIIRTGGSSNKSSSSTKTTQPTPQPNMSTPTGPAVGGITKQQMDYVKSLNNPLSKYSTPLTYYKSKQTGSIQDEYGRNIPIIEYQTSEPTGTLAIGKYKFNTYNTRASTKQEQELLKDNSLKASTKKYNKNINKAKEIYSSASNTLSYSNKLASNTLKGVGATDKNIERFANVVSYTNPLALVGGRKFVKGAVSSMGKNIRDKPISNLALYGASYGVGAVGGTAPTVLREGLRKVPLVSRYAQPIANIGKTGVTVGGGILSTSYIAQAGFDVALSSSQEEAGEKFGTYVTDGFIVGAGLTKGLKTSNKIKGIIASRGRKPVEIPQGDYPQAPTNKQLELFTKNIFPEFSKKPGSFHTTPQKFWGDIITPKTSASELEGLYTSTYISRPFAKIPGTSGKGKGFRQAVMDSLFLKKGNDGKIEIDTKKIVSDLFVEKEPGVVFAVPKGYREVGVRFTKYKRFEGQKYVNKKGYAEFITPPKKGFMDLPLIKTEIESIARPEAGSYLISPQSGKYYTEIKGVRVPIDVFESEYLNNPAVKDTIKSLNKVRGKSSYGGRPSSTSSVISPSYTSSVTKDYLSKKSSSASISKSYLSSSSLSSSSSSSLLSSNSISGSSSGRGSSRGGSSSASKGLSSATSLVSKSISKTTSSFVKPAKSFRLDNFLKSIPNTPKSFIRNNKPIQYSPLRQGYLVQVRRKGKFQTIASNLPKGKALFVGSKSVLKDLSATFRLRKAGTTRERDIGFSLTKSIFRTPKRKSRLNEPFTFIQREGGRKGGISTGRLTTFGERRAIQRARLKELGGGYV